MANKKSGVTNKQKRTLLSIVLVVVVAFLIWVILWSLMPFTVAEPAGAWQKFVEWHVTARGHIFDFIYLYAFLAALIFGGGYLLTKGR